MKLHSTKKNHVSFRKMENTSENQVPVEWFTRMCGCVRRLCHQGITYFTRHTMPITGEAPIVEIVIKILEDTMMILEATLPMMATMTALAPIGYTIRTSGWSVYLGLQFFRGTPLSLLILRDSFVFFDFYTNASAIERVGTMVLSVIFWINFMNYY